MKRLPLLLSLALLPLASACSSSDAPDAGAALPETECRALVGKSLEIHGMPPDTFAQELEADIATCAEKGTLSQEEFDCGMAATSPAEFEACGIDIS